MRVDPKEEKKIPGQPYANKYRVQSSKMQPYSFILMKFVSIKVVYRIIMNTCHLVISIVKYHQSAANVKFDRSE